MKEPWEWEEADLLALITDQVQEDISLDFKESAALEGRTDRQKDEISKDVSAFANSAGGTIVYGIREESHLPVEIDGGLDPRGGTREWLEQVINSRIQRRIDGVRINPVSLGGPAAGRVAYVVHVPQSLRAPHQASNKKFYKRSNSQSVPMEEYEVRDVANRSAAPELSLVVRFASGRRQATLPSGSESHFSSVGAEFLVTNTAPTPAEYSVIRLLIDDRLKIEGDSELGFRRKRPFHMRRGDLVFRFYQMILKIPDRPPVWEGEDMPLHVLGIGLSFPLEKERLYLLWEITSPRMGRRHGSYTFEIEGDSAIIRDSPDLWP